MALHGAGGNVLHRVTWFGMFFSDRGPCETLAGQGKTSDSCGHPARRLSQRYPHAAPFSFFHRARRCLSFRQDEKKDRGAQCAVYRLQTGKRKRIATAVCALPRNDEQWGRDCTMKNLRVTAGFFMPGQVCGQKNRKKYFLLNQQKFLTLFVNYANIHKCVGAETGHRQSPQKSPDRRGFSALCVQPATTKERRNQCLLLTSW